MRMNWFRNFNTSAKLMSGFVVVSAFLAVNGWIAITHLRTVNANLENVYEVQLMQLNELADIRERLQVIRRFSYSTLMAPTPESTRTLIDEVRKIDREMKERVEQFITLIRTEEVRTVFNRFKAAFEDYKQYREERQYAPLLAGKKELAQQSAVAGTAFIPCQEALEDLYRIKKEVARKKFDESQSIYSSSRETMVAFIIAGLILGLLLGYGISRLITVPLREAMSVLESVTAGDLSKRVNVNSSDEVGRLAVGLNKAIDTIRRHMSEVAEAAEKEGKSAEELRNKAEQILEVVNAASQGDLTRELHLRGTDVIGQMAQELAAFFGNLRKNIADISQTAQTLASSSQELTAVSQQMSANAEETACQANVASAAADQVSQNVATVATAAEEMGASIKEIARSASEAANVATSAVKIAERTNVTVSKLGESSTEIGNVIKVITTIAQQTNLLALNAAIEAARAGEAGKGFAVVANEVKELAKQTASATEGIGRRIEAIQADTEGAVAAISQIGIVINQINDTQNTIASAVEEQTATTGDIIRNVSQAAGGSADIAENVTGVAQAARSTSDGAVNTKDSADQLARLAVDLRKLVSQFKF